MIFLPQHVYAAVLPGCMHSVSALMPAPPAFSSPHIAPPQLGPYERLYETICLCLLWEWGSACSRAHHLRLWHCPAVAAWTLPPSPSQRRPSPLPKMAPLCLRIAFAAMARDPSAVSLETFVLHSLSAIAQECSGRAPAQREVRQAAIKLLGKLVQRVSLPRCDRCVRSNKLLTAGASRPAEELGVADFGKPGSRLSVPFPQDVTAQVRQNGGSKSLLAPPAQPCPPACTAAAPFASSHA